MIVLPSSRASNSNIRINATALVLSNPDVYIVERIVRICQTVYNEKKNEERKYTLTGSSRRIMAGSVSNSDPIFTRFLSPPLIMKIGVSAHFARRS